MTSREQPWRGPRVVGPSARPAAKPVSPATPTDSASPTRTGVVLGLLMGPSALGVTAAAVAIPEAASSLGSSPVQLTWALSVYIVVLALASAVGGRLMPVVGGGAVLKSGSALLAAGAVGTVVSPGVAVLTVSRGLLAVGAGLLAGLALGLAGETPADRRPQVLSAFAAVMAASVGIGPVLGGLVAPWLWQLAFASPVLSLLAAPAASAAAGGVGRRPSSTLDVAGLVWTVLAAGGLIVFVQAAASSAGASTLVLLAAVTLVAVYASARRVRLRPDGFLPKPVVARRDLVGWWIAALGAQAGQVSALVLVPVVLAERHGWSAPVIGVALAVLSLGGVWSSRVVAKQVDVPGGTRLGATLTVLLAAALVVMSVAQASWLLLLAGLLGFSAFSGIQVVAMHHVSGRVPADMIAPATGILSLVFLIGGAVGSSLASLAATWVGFGHAGIIAAVPPLAAAVAAFAVARSLGGSRG